LARFEDCEVKVAYEAGPGGFRLHDRLILDFRNVKPSTDVYAMGISLHFLLTGAFPYDFPMPRRSEWKWKDAAYEGI